MRVVVLGAGASKSYGASPTKQRMPIARDFFPTFMNLDIASNPWVLRDGITYYLKNFRGVEDPDAYLKSGIDIEELHSEIASHLPKTSVSAEEIITYTRPYQQLLFLFASTLNEIANGPVSEPHIDLANFLTTDDNIITFNWDTLMEKALKETHDWNVEDGYGIAPNKIFRDGWNNVDPNKKSPAPKILKLHGSVNWLTAYTIYQKEKLVLSHALPPESLFVYEYATKPYETHQGRYTPGYEPFTYGYYPPNLLDVPGITAGEDRVFVKITPEYPWMPKGEGGNQGLVSMPLIIPPVKEKTYDFFGTLFSDIWSQASTLLRDADEIILIGYSFPQTDLRSNRLFSEAFMRRKTLPKVSIIDPSPDKIAHKFRMEFGIPDTHLSILAEPFLGMESLKKMKF